MPIIGKVGRRSFKVILLSTSIHVVLCLGCLTMLYPFAIMLSGSFKSNVDSNNLDLVPKFFYDDEVHYRKWVESKYNEATGDYNLCHRGRIYSFDSVDFPRERVAKRFEDWNGFLAANDGLSHHNYNLGHMTATGIRPELARRFINALKDEPDIQGDVEALNAKYEVQFPSWDAVILPSRDTLRRGAGGKLDPFEARAMEFAATQGPSFRNYHSVDAFFVTQVLKPRYGQRLWQINKALGTSFRTWDDVTLARTVPAGPLRADWTFFVKERLSVRFIEVLPDATAGYRAYQREKYRKIELYNRRYETALKSFDEIALPVDPPETGVPAADWDYFITEVVAPEHLRVRSTETMWRDFLRKKYRDIAKLAAAHAYGVAEIDAFPLDDRLPRENLPYRADWVAFVDEHVDDGFVRPDSAAARAWREFVTKPYARDKQVNLDALNAALKTDFASTGDIYLPLAKPDTPELAAQWLAFVRGGCPPDLLVIDAKRAGEAWHAFLTKRYMTAANLNVAYGLAPASFETVALPNETVDYFVFRDVEGPSFRQFLTRNYATVLDMMLYNGRAIQNTVLYCALAIIGALIVNPMAAYALSRYKPPSQYKLLLFLMLTMAFPPMVLGIPNFLLIRKLGLLNTFFALVLPGVANGYSIFILKGFFDSLPRELYESAQLDGASEWTMFWHITMATSKPILAVIALNAFQMAYANFMMAFILCQDPNRWTIMVHMYQLQQRSAQGVVFASILIAALPTLLVFVFCQNIILRGIVVPTEK